MRRTILHTLVVVAVLFFASSISLACTCNLPPMNKTEKQLVELERKKSKAIFVGEVTEIIVPKTPAGEPGWVAEVKFKVQRTWKGVELEEVRVFTANVCCICGYEFKVGESYLVYAYGSDKLHTDTCTRTSRLADAETDLKVLGKAKALKSRKA
jgi:hypothetical protein